MAHPTINIAINAAHIAGDLMRQEFPKVASIPVTQKARHDYVTEIDKSCEAQIVREIRRYHPDHAILGEEGGAQGESDHVWIIDSQVLPRSCLSLRGEWRARRERGRLGHRSARRHQQLPARDAPFWYLHRPASQGPHRARHRI